MDCSWSCPENCKQCNDTRCSSCVNGHYDLSSHCNKTCPVNCLACSSEDKCKQCKAGFYNGHEMDDPKFQYIESCNWSCRPNCSECTQHNACQKCFAGTYGSVCEKQCSIGCQFNTCDRNTGACPCENSFSGDKCCVRSPYCKTCSSVIDCAECVAGHHGESCQYNCNNTCLNDCVKSSGNYNACIHNTHGNFCENNCSAGCLDNTNDSTMCNRSTGLCLHGCRAGFYGEKCEHLCSARCKDGCDAVSGFCNDCVPNCENSCSVGCSNESSSVSACNSSTGGCLSSCKTGFFSDSCDKKCAQTCKRGCDRATGYCDSCAEDKYGSYCNGTCPKNCFSKNKNETKCNESNGICLFGCKERYNGENCTEKYSEKCAGDVCNASTGHCLHGCKAGFMEESVNICVVQGVKIGAMLSSELAMTVFQILTVFIVKIASQRDARLSQVAYRHVTHLLESVCQVAKPGSSLTSVIESVHKHVKVGATEQPDIVTLVLKINTDRIAVAPVLKIVLELPRTKQSAMKVTEFFLTVGDIVTRSFLWKNTIPITLFKHASNYMLAAKGVYRKENMTEQTVGTYETLEAGQENQLTDYDTVQNRNSDYANTVV